MFKFIGQKQPQLSPLSVITTPTIEMSQDSNKTIIESYKSANKAWRSMIQIKDEEISRLDHFEERFLNMTDNFTNYEMLARKHDKQTDYLQVRLDEELRKQRQTENDLRLEIAQIRKSIEEQCLENEKLESNLKEKVDTLHMLKQSEEQSTGSYADPLHFMTSPFVGRLSSNF